MQRTEPADPIDMALTRRIEIDAMLARLAARCDRLFDKRPADVGWSDANELDLIAERLRRVCKATLPGD